MRRIFISLLLSSSMALQCSAKENWEMYYAGHTYIPSEWVHSMKCECKQNKSMSSYGKESEHYHSEIWQGSNGKIYIKIFTFETHDDLCNHIYEIDRLNHSIECNCDIINN